MSFANSSEVRVAFVAESGFGVTPATPTFRTLRATGGGLRTNKTTGTSNERQPDRNVRDEFQLGQDVAGTYQFELSYGAFDDFLEGALFGAWSSNVLKNGVTRKSFTVEETLELGATDSFSRFAGVMVNQFSLAVAARAPVTGSFDLMGRQEALDAAIVTGATYTAAPTEPISTASANVASLTVGSISPAPKVKTLNLQVANGLKTRPVVGDLYSQEFGTGRTDVTGTLEAYFETGDLYAAVLAHGGGALSFTVGNATNKRYTFLLPKLIFGNGERRVGGNDDDVVITIPFRAVYDTTEACSIKITRAVA